MLVLFKHTKNEINSLLNPKKENAFIKKVSLLINKYDFLGENETTKQKKGVELNKY